MKKEVIQLRRLSHILEAQQFDRRFIQYIFNEADRMRELVRHRDCNILRGKIMACLFYEPSTRTRFSFESAMIRLGGSVLTTENAKKFSSVSKGETIRDSISVMSTYADIIVMRHNEEGSAKEAAAASKVPIINAGDGSGQHPTQTLLDLYTIWRELGRLDNIKIAMIGDLKNGRTVRSLSYVLGKYSGIKIFYVAPENCRMRKDILDFLDRHGTIWEETDDIDDVLHQVDCVYMTRIQKERFSDSNEYEEAKSKYVIDSGKINKMPFKSILMHPLPRVDEINPEVDHDSRSVYFKQAENGLYVRMALLKHLLE